MKTQEYLRKISAIPAGRIAYIDETGVDQYLYREYGRSKRGEKIYGRVSGRKYRRVGIVAAQMGKEILAPLQYDGTMDSELFEIWFETRLLPSLPEESVIVMDNAAFHRKSRLIPMAQKAGFQLVFLPPYSPEFNPIENFWSWLKRQLRKLLSYFRCFDDALSACFHVW